MDNIIKVIASTFKVDGSEITRDTRCEEIKGWDSLGMLTLISELESTLKVIIPIEKIAEIRCVGDLSDLIKDRE